MISKGLHHYADTLGKRSSSSKGKLESLGGSAGGGLTRPIQVTVTLEERLKKHQGEGGSNSAYSGSNTGEARSKALTP